MNKITVIKYGGSSVGDFEKMKALTQKIKTRHLKGESMVIVVSAMGKTTNTLIHMAQEATESPTERELDVLLSTGEQVAMALLTMMLNDIGVNALSLTGAQAGILTQGRHTQNKIKAIETHKLLLHLKKGLVPVVAGFQGVNENGDITTLGRGGSDTTAVAIAASLGAKCEIYTDVSGIYGVDPRLYKEAKRLPQINYDEMIEMAFLGAKVMEPRSVEIAKHYGVPIYVASAHENQMGTWIVEGETQMEERSITGLSVSENVLMVNIHNIKAPTQTIAGLFALLAEETINVDMISQTLAEDGHAGLAFTVPLGDEKTLNRLLKGFFQKSPHVKIHTQSHIVKLSVVGSGMRTQSGIASKIFSLFAQNQIPYLQTTTSEISISYTIKKEFMPIAVSLIAKEFEL